MQQTINVLDPLAREKGVQVVSSSSPPCGEIPVGPLGPVIMNGLRNAIEACAEVDRAQRRVEASLTLTLRPAEVSIIICDSGPGIHEVPQPGVSTKQDGRGIGLTVCRDILAQLDGRLDLSNIPFGGGAVFHARIPLRSLVEA